MLYLYSNTSYWKSTVFKIKWCSLYIKLILTYLCPYLAGQSKEFNEWIIEAIPRITILFKQCSSSILSCKYVTHSSQSARQRLYSSFAHLASVICSSCWSSINRPTGFELRDLCVSTLISMLAFNDKISLHVLTEIRNQQFNLQLDHLLCGIPDVTSKGEVYLKDLGRSVLFSLGKELKYELMNIPGLLFYFLNVHFTTYWL